MFHHFTMRGAKFVTVTGEEIESKVCAFLFPEEEEAGSDEAGSDESGSDEAGSDEAGSDEAGSDEAGSDDDPMAGSEEEEEEDESAVSERVCLF
jgi:hypothetical protein